jgi:ATP-dependent Clp protease ATP-binding subunit ClpX
MEKLIKFYGIELEPDVLKNIPEQDLKEICHLLFLSVNIPVARVKEILHDMESNPNYDYKSLKEFLAGQIRNSRDFINDNLRIYFRVEHWTDVFDTPGMDAMEEIIELYGTNPEETERIRKLGNELKIQSTADIKTLLDKYVIGQEEAKRSVSLVFYIHLLRNNMITPGINRLTKASRMSKTTELPKSNLVLIGPTGSGKTLILNQLSKIFDIPFVKIDCASLVASGYVGNNLNDTLFDGFSKLQFKIENASKAVIYFDEFDKISESQYRRSEGSVGGVELQQEFLSVVENDTLSVRPHYKSEKLPFHIPANNIMFVFSGSFAGMESIIMRRLKMDAVGFKYGKNKRNVNHSDFEPMLHATHNDLIEFGMIPELVSRVNYIVPLHRLTREDIITIIRKSEISHLKLYENFFNVHYDELVIEEEVYELIAEEVLKKGIGARAINSVLQSLLNDYLFESTDRESRKYVITPEYFRSVFGPG